MGLNRTIDRKWRSVVRYGEHDDVVRVAPRRLIKGASAGHEGEDRWSLPLEQLTRQAALGIRASRDHPKGRFGAVRERYPDDIRRLELTKPEEDARTLRPRVHVAEEHGRAARSWGRTEPVPADDMDVRRHLDVARANFNADRDDRCSHTDRVDGQADRTRSAPWRLVVLQPRRPNIDRGNTGRGRRCPGLDRPLVRHGFGEARIRRPGEETEVGAWPSCPHRHRCRDQDQGTRKAQARDETQPYPGRTWGKGSLLTRGRLLVRFHQSRRASGLLTGTADRWGRAIDADRAR